MFKAIILGDIHLGKGVSIGKELSGSVLNSRIQDQLNILNWTLEQALTKLVDVIIITGDIFEDPKPHYSLISQFMYWLKTCSNHNIKVHIIFGNHDILRSGNIYNSPLDIIDQVDLENVFVHRDISTLFFDKMAITFMPFRDRNSLNAATMNDAIEMLSSSIQYELALIKPELKKVLIGHLAIEGSFYVGDEVDTLSNEIFCPLSMFSGYDYVWMGHVHTPQVMQKSPLVAHVGSMDISNFKESDQDKHIVIVSEDSYEEISIPTRKLNDLIISVPAGVDTTQYVLEQIEKEELDLNSSIVRLKINLEDVSLQPVNKKEIMKHFSDNNVFNVCSFAESKKVEIVRSHQLSIDNTITTEIALSKWAEQKFTDQKDKDLFISKGLELLSNLN